MFEFDFKDADRTSFKIDEETIWLA